jgi:hypothetical protein
MRKLLSFVITISLILTGCTEDSALSDVEISDPSIIAPYILVSRSIDENNNFDSKIEVWLYDKNGNSIELKKGEVRLNHTKMSLKKLILTKAPYYSGENVVSKVELNTNYSFEIELSDGKIYAASIQTQDKDLNQLSLPINYSKQNDMDISWKEIYMHDKMDVQLNRYIKTDTSGGQSFTTLNIPPLNISKGSFTVTKDNFNNLKDNCYKAIITVIGTKNGTIDNSFSSNKKIISAYSIAKETSVN